MRDSGRALPVAGVTYAALGCPVRLESEEIDAVLDGPDQLRHVLRAFAEFHQHPGAIHGPAPQHADPEIESARIGRAVQDVVVQGRDEIAIARGGAR